MTYDIKIKPGQKFYQVRGKEKKYVIKANLSYILINNEINFIKYYAIGKGKVVYSEDEENKVGEQAFVWSPFYNHNIDTGNSFESVPVFTTKERCVEWLKSIKK